MALKAGDKAPEVLGVNQDGKEIRLSDFAGKKLVLYFYPKDNTPGCTAQACSLRDGYDDLRKAGYEVLGVSADNASSHQKFIAKQKLDLTLLSDVSTEVAGAYGVWQLKKFCGKEYMGIVRSTFLIDPSGKIAHIWSNVKVAGHAQEVKNVLESLQK